MQIHCAHDAEVEIADLKPHPANPNKHPDSQIALLAKIITAQGWRNPIVVSNRSGFITKGHGRLAAAKLAGLEVAPVDYQDYENEKQELADMIADNRIAELAEADRSMLRELAEKLDDGAFDMDLTGFDQEALEELMTAAPPESDIDAEPQIDKAEELRKKWGVERGQIWELGEHRIMCGDAFAESVMNGDSADAIITDPPYGMSLRTDFSTMHKRNRFGKGGNDYKLVEGDDDEFNPIPLFEHFDSVKEQFWFGADYYRQHLPTGGSWFVWDKRGNDQGMHLDDLLGAAFELCWSRHSHKREVARIVWAGHHGMQREDKKKRQHPTQKPTELYRWLIERCTNKPQIILDFFVGSGTTIIACEQLGRKCRAMEIDPGYVAVSIQRWADATGKTPKLLTSIPNQGKDAKKRKSIK
jgi:DNA modification methylase